MMRWNENANNNAEKMWRQVTRQILENFAKGSTHEEDLHYWRVLQIQVFLFIENLWDLLIFLQPIIEYDSTTMVHVWENLGFYKSWS